MILQRHMNWKIRDNLNWECQIFSSIWSFQQTLINLTIATHFHRSHHFKTLWSIQPFLHTSIDLTISTAFDQSHHFHTLLSISPFLHPFINLTISTHRPNALLDFMQNHFFDHSKNLHHLLKLKKNIKNFNILHSYLTWCKCFIHIYIYIYIL